MATLQDVMREARKTGAIVRDVKEFGVHECRVEAPVGHIWTGHDIHEFVDAANLPWKPDYADLLSRMSSGVSKCTNAECDWCHPED